MSGERRLGDTHGQDNPAHDWIEQLIAVGEELGGVELALAEDQPATSADLSMAWTDAVPD
jgi:hypothetical protein